MVRYGAAGLLALFLFAPSGAFAQNKITHDKWEGFVIRNPEGAFDSCVLYDRSIDALSVSPFNMLGITRNAAGRVGLLVFYTPRTFIRAKKIPVTVKLDSSPPVTLTGRAVSDFHISVEGPFGAPLVTALEKARHVEISAEDHMISFEISEVDGVLRTLTDCVNANAH